MTEAELSLFSEVISPEAFHLSTWSCRAAPLKEESLPRAPTRDLSCTTLRRQPE